MRKMFLPVLTLLAAFTLVVTAADERASANSDWLVIDPPSAPLGATFGPIWSAAYDDTYLWAQRTTGDVPDGWLYHWDGDSWTEVLSLPGHAPVDVVGTGPGDVFAAVDRCTTGWGAGCGPDRGGRVFRSTDGGATWVEQTLPPEMSDKRASRMSGTPGNVHMIFHPFTFGPGSGIARFDGTNWSTVYMGEWLNDLTIVGPNEGYSVTCWGWAEWDGGSWHFNHQGWDFCDVADVWGMREGGDLHMYAVGNNNFSNGIRVWRFNETPPTFGSKYGYFFGDGGRGNAGAVWGSAADNVYVGGWLGGFTDGALYHFDGASWHRIDPIAGMDNVSGISGNALGDVWVSLASGPILLKHGAAPAGEINDLLSMANLETSFDPNPAPDAPAGVFTISATFINVSSSSLFNQYFEVAALSGHAVVLNCEGGPGGAGCNVPIPASALGPDGVLSPGESFTAEFEIGLTQVKPFDFFVDAWGSVKTDPDPPG